MDEQIAGATVSEQVTIFEIGASVEVELDMGFRPYMDYLNKLGNKSPQFGTREQSKKKIAMWGKAQVPAGANPEAAAQDLANQLQRLVYQQLELEGVRVEDPDAGAFISTTVSAQIGGNEAW